MTTVSVSQKFQIVIPKAIREAIGIISGQKFEFIAYKNRIALIPLRPMKKMRGFLKGIETEVPREGGRV